MNGLISIRSNYSVSETVNRIASIAGSKGLMIFSRIDHSGNASQQGLQLRPTELIIFGNPKAGTFLMQDEQTSGIDLPLKALAWEDASGKVWLSYNDVDWIAQRHNLTEKSKSITKAIKDVMELICHEATEQQAG